MQIKGIFEVTGTPHPTDQLDASLNARRMTFRKIFHGDLDATSIAEMMGMMNKDLGSGAYVALECLTGKVQSKNGTFCLQHSSTMTRGRPCQIITVVPDSGTEDLKGLAGSMTIDIVDGKHFYTFDYTF